MFSKKLRRALKLLALCGLGVAIRAQVPPTSDPGAIHQQNSETEQYLRLQRQIEKSKPPSGPALRDESTVRNNPVDKSAATFLLAHVDLSSSAILTKSEETAITSRYEGRVVSFGDLDAMLRELNALYASKGFVTAKAVLPPQTIASGVVQVRLIESRLGKIIVQNAGSTRTPYFTHRLPYRSGDLIRVNAINSSLQRFNLTNDVRISALLRPGEQFGTTDLVLQVQSPPPLSVAVSSDDAGLTSTGRERIGSTGTLENVFGYRDPLRVGGYWSDGMWAGFASYDFPLGASGFRLGPELSYDTIRVRQSALQKLGFAGSFYDLSVRLSRPLAVRPRLRLTAYLAPHFQESSLNSQGYRISNIPVRSLEMGVSLQSPDRQGFWAANLFSSGGDYNALKLNAFVKFGGSVTRFQTLGRNFTAVFRASGQGKAADPTPLPPSQQFQIGGLSTVRGYPEGSFIGDAGYATSAELDGPFPFGRHKVFGRRINETFRTAAFLDHAGLLTPSQTFLTGAGGGLIVNLSQYLEGRIYVGTPLEHGSNYHPTQIHFAVEARPPLARALHLFRKTEAN